MQFRPLVPLLIFGLALSGCAAGTVRPLPTTAEGCQAEFDATNGRIRSTPTYVTGNNAGASLIGAAIGKGIAKGAAESRFTACMDQVRSGTVPGTQTSSPAPRPAASAPEQPRTAPPRPVQSRHSADCRGSVLVGGDGYCIRNGN